MSGYVGKIEKGAELDATQYFDGPWKSFRRIELSPGQQERFTADTVEHSVFVMSGHGSYLFGGTDHELTPGHAVTVGYGSEILVTAHDTEALELFVTALSVDLN